MAVPEKQTAIQINTYGDKFDASPAEVPVPKPGPGEALVRMLLRPLNPADVFSALGVYPGFAPKSLPAVLGLEGVGTVAALGPDASGRLAVGQRVVSSRWPSHEGNGTWQQFVAVEEQYLVPVPDELSDEAACQALINPVTVVGMFEDLATPKGEWVIITAAGSALGRMALQYAKSLGLRTIGTVRRAEQVEELKAEGADEVVVVPGPVPLGERVMQITGGKGAWGALECIAGDMPLQVAPGVRVNGSIIVYGAMSGIDVPWSAFQPVFRQVALKGFWLVPWLAAKPVEEQRGVMARVLDLMSRGVLPPHKVEARPLEEAAAALRDQGQVGRPAKYVLRG